MKDAISVDDVVRMAIEDLFPDQTIPDENNHLPDGSQHKAPDHLILDGAIAIERKSRNSVDQSQFYEKLREIAFEQGAPFWGVGRINLKVVLRQLPDPESATRKLTDFVMNQVTKTVRKAEKKFSEYERFVPRAGQLRILVIADNTEIREGTAAAEYFLGRKMGAISSADDRAAILDAIFYIKDPRFTLDEKDSYWFKALVRKRLGPNQMEKLNVFISGLHHRVAHYEPYFTSATNFSNSSLQICLV